MKAVCPLPVTTKHTLPRTHADETLTEVDYRKTETPKRYQKTETETEYHEIEIDYYYILQSKWNPQKELWNLSQKRNKTIWDPTGGNTPVQEECPPFYRTR